MAEPRELRISHVGAQGDGVARDNGTQVFIPFTLPGERVKAAVSGDQWELVEVLEPSPVRVEPVCRHFGQCGGCSVQHMATEAYRNWKRDLVVSAFRARGLDCDVAAMVAHAGKRRRAVLAVERNEAGVVIGFHKGASHALVAIEECPVLEPKIVASLPALRALVVPLLSRHREARLTVTLTLSGLDVELDATERRLTPELRSHLAAEVNRLALSRLVVGGEIICETSPPMLRFGPAEVALPPGVFVQAVAEAESEIARRIVDAVGKPKSVADLFCGLGAFTFPLAMKTRVTAYDGDRRAIAALAAAAKRTQGLKPVTAQTRDLFREPLSPLELNEHDAIVFDPPRPGAEAQARRLAKSKVKTIVAVSCNPATLARDARHLIDGGYRLQSATPIDQFVYSAHVEVVAVFRR
jgi:23S rRNA (uracil1939-C5)-methyltransferase